MFQWYKNTKTCYIYLLDVEKTSDLQAMHRRISRSRWFTRGWTLQELVPSTACFYSTDWSNLGTNTKLVTVGLVNLISCWYHCIADSAWLVCLFNVQRVRNHLSMLPFSRILRYPRLGASSVHRTPQNLVNDKALC
jgi:hypothetical protein